MTARQPYSLHPFAGWDLPRLVDAQADRLGSAIFLAWEPRDGTPTSMSYREFADDSARVAYGLERRGVGRGDRVAIIAENCPEFLLTWAACTRLGAIAVTLNTRLSALELRHAISDCGATVAVVQRAHQDTVADAAGDLIRSLIVIGDGQRIAPDGQVAAFDALLGDQATYRVQPPDPWLPASIQYTSGTTARPKGVVWTMGNLLWAARNGAVHEALTQADTQLVCLPLFHMNAISTGVLATLWAGSKVVLQPRFSASRFWPVSLRHRCTFAAIIPFMVHALAQFEVPDNHHYRLWAQGISAPGSRTRFGVPTMGWWGMTETTTVAIVSSPYHDDAPRGIGRPSPSYEVAVVDDEGHPVAAGVPGDLRVRGVPGLSLFQGYWGNETATREAFDDAGYLITGDIVRYDDDGVIKFVDRAKDMLKVGGENVAASEIEHVIGKVPGVREVAVVGRPDRMLGEVAVAFVLPSSAGDNQLMQRIDSTCAQALADFKRPREVRLVSSLPRATVNKVAKGELRLLLQADSSKPESQN